MLISSVPFQFLKKRPGLYHDQNFVKYFSTKSSFFGWVFQKSITLMNRFWTKVNRYLKKCKDEFSRNRSGSCGMSHAPKSNRLNLLPTQFVSIIRHQHRSSLFLKKFRTYESNHFRNHAISYSFKNCISKSQNKNDG